jgi:hypothetical protein
VSKPKRLPPDQLCEVAVADLDQLLVDLHAPDPLTRASAVRQLCPCRSGPELYARYRGEVRRLQKDPSPLVRANALHVEQDALEQEAKLARWRAEQHRRRTHQAAASPEPERTDTAHRQQRQRQRGGGHRRAALSCPGALEDAALDEAGEELLEDPRWPRQRREQRRRRIRL